MIIFSTTERPENADLADFGHLNDAEAFRERFSDSECAILEYENSKASLSEAFVEDMSGNIVMQLFSCWILDAGQSIEGMINKIKSLKILNMEI